MTDYGSLETCREARAIIEGAPAKSISPTIASTGVTNGRTPGEFCVVVRDSEIRIFPPTYDPKIVELMVAHGLGGVQISYESVAHQPQQTQSIS